MELGRSRREGSERAQNGKPKHWQDASAIRPLSREFQRSALKGVIAEQPRSTNMASMKEHNRKTLVRLVNDLEASRGKGVALAEATRWTLLEEIDRLLASGVDPDVRLEKNMTPLMYAGTSKSAQRLLKAGADANAVDVDGATPLIWFFKGRTGKREAISRVKLLLSHGADPSIKDRTGQTAIDYARPKYDNDLLALLQ